MRIYGGLDWDGDVILDNIFNTNIFPTISFILLITIYTITFNEEIQLDFSQAIFIETCIPWSPTGQVRFYHT